MRLLVLALLLVAHAAFAQTFNCTVPAVAFTCTPTAPPPTCTPPQPPTTVQACPAGQTGNITTSYVCSGSTWTPVVTNTCVTPPPPGGCPTGTTVQDMPSTQFQYSLRASSTQILAFKFNAKRSDSSSYGARWTANNRDPTVPAPTAVTWSVSTSCGVFNSQLPGACGGTGATDGTQYLSYDPTAPAWYCQLNEAGVYYLNMKFTTPTGASGCSAPQCGLALDF